jgi:transcriptional regulator
MKDKKQALAFMQTYPFATIINTKENYPLATHLPFAVKEVAGQLQLTAHFAKANKQWELLEQAISLVIFQEPHAYISPQHYNKRQNVPTWNYVAVHAYGQARIVTDHVQGFAILEDLIQNSEAAYQQQWESLDFAYKKAMYEGIVPFVVEVTNLEAKVKLSQDKKADERSRIAAALSSSENKLEQTIGDFMKDL